MKNSQRPFVKLIKEVCEENNITVDSFSYDWIFRLSRENKVIHIFGYQFSNNSATAQLICSDKCATSDILLFNGIPSVKHEFFMSPTNINYVGVSGNWERILRMLKKYGRLVCKTNEGSGGTNVYLVSNQFELERVVHKIFRISRAMAISPFYEVEKEYRTIVLDDETMLIYQKNIPFVKGDGKSTLRQLLISFAQTHPEFLLSLDQQEENNNVLDIGEIFWLNWKHNLGQGASPEIVHDRLLIEELSNLALRATNAVNIKFASVDIIKTTANEFLVLEINSGIMMDNFSQVDDCNYQLAKDIYRKAIESMLA